MYKALITDVDGTLVQNKLDGIPSPAVKSAIARARNLIHIGIATSRPPFVLEDIFASVELSGPCIVSGGTQIYDATTKKIVWEKFLNPESLERIYEVLKEYVPQVYVNNGGSDEEYIPGHPPTRPLGMFAPSLDQEAGNEAYEKLLKIPDIAPQKCSSHHIGKMDVDVTHSEATKLHGILEVAKILNIDTKEIIGVGDGYNDFPLLMACGLKVAMGNAVDELKAIADYVAPTVDDDGLADVIEKYVLKVL